MAPAGDESILGFRKQIFFSFLFWWKEEENRLAFLIVYLQGRCREFRKEGGGASGPLRTARRWPGERLGVIASSNYPGALEIVRNATENGAHRREPEQAPL